MNAGKEKTRMGWVKAIGIFGGNWKTALLQQFFFKSCPSLFQAIFLSRLGDSTVADTDKGQAGINEYSGEFDGGTGAVGAKPGGCVKAELDKYAGTGGGAIFFFDFFYKL